MGACPTVFWRTCVAGNLVLACALLRTRLDERLLREHTLGLALGDLLVRLRCPPPSTGVGW